VQQANRFVSAKGLGYVDILAVSVAIVSDTCRKSKQKSRSFLTINVVKNDETSSVTPDFRRI
jgi:hypothetical protein